MGIIIIGWEYIQTLQNRSLSQQKRRKSLYILVTFPKLYVSYFRSKKKEFNFYFPIKIDF
jgi:hypothetical protein